MLFPMDVSDLQEKSLYCPHCHQIIPVKKFDIQLDFDIGPIDIFHVRMDYDHMVNTGINGRNSFIAILCPNCNNHMVWISNDYVKLMPILTKLGIENPSWTIDFRMIDSTCHGSHHFSFQSKRQLLYNPLITLTSKYNPHLYRITGEETISWHRPYSYNFRVVYSDIFSLGKECTLKDRSELPSDQSFSKLLHKCSIIEMILRVIDIALYPIDTTNIPELTLEDLETIDMMKKQLDQYRFEK